MDIDIKTIKDQITKSIDEMGVSVESIILFGSRARGDYNEDSDYDILIVTEKTFPFKEKIRIADTVRKRLVKLRISSDIIIKSPNEIEYFRDKIGSVTREALREGVTL
ncbi:MAG: nucleotidyltransferase domain-containing protein [Candidatus Poribacteria bacterium]